MDALRVTEPWRPHPRPARSESNPPDLWVPGEIDARAALLARARAGDAEALRLVEERYRVRLHVVSPTPSVVPVPTRALVRQVAEVTGDLCGGCGKPMVRQPRRRGAPRRYHGPACRQRAWRRKHAVA